MKRWFRIDWSGFLTRGGFNPGWTKPKGVDRLVVTMIGGGGGGGRYREPAPLPWGNTAIFTGHVSPSETFTVTAGGGAAINDGPYVSGLIVSGTDANGERFTIPLPVWEPWL